MIWILFKIQQNWVWTKSSLIKYERINKIGIIFLAFLCFWTLYGYDSLWLLPLKFRLSVPSPWEHRFTTLKHVSKWAYTITITLWFIFEFEIFAQILPKISLWTSVPPLNNSVFSSISDPPSTIVQFKLKPMKSIQWSSTPKPKV